ncbi:hypothetical protein [Nocardia sp. NPDC049149]|uniref:hypothetical protein n=1 Tax=Nocardia sp. NPDC049149 TaxID=3364315 RepID=UPI0037104D50
MQSANEFSRWTSEFEAKTVARAAAGDPDWGRGAALDSAVAKSIQRFQVGESGDGANLIAKADAAGDPVYARAAFAKTSAPARLIQLVLWWIVLIGSTAVVAADHGPALRVLGVTRTGFLLDVLGLFRTIVPTALSSNVLAVARIPAQPVAGLN